MTIDEIKDKIRLESPTGPVPYQRDFRRKQLQKRVETFETEWRRNLYHKDNVEQFLWEFNNRQLGHTTEMLIEALAQMSEGKLVRITTHNDTMHRRVQYDLKKYCQQLGIRMLYAGKNEQADWTRTDHAVADIAMMNTMWKKNKI